MRRPSTRTVQAPHWPWSQPFLVPVRPRFSRRASSSVTRGSSFNSCFLPLSRNVTGTVAGAPGLAGWASAAREEDSPLTPPPTARPPARAGWRKSRPDARKGRAGSRGPAFDRFPARQNHAVGVVLATEPLVVANEPRRHVKCRTRLGAFGSARNVRDVRFEAGGYGISPCLGQLYL